jgi:choline dehydrogenase-like flavoprotein
MVAERGEPADYDAWGITGWSWADIEPWFERISIPLHAAGERGSLGESLLAAGVGARPALLTRDRAGRRASAADVYLARARCEIRTGAEVDRLLFDEDRRAAGVRMPDGEEIESRTVVVCAGAINTPLLLQRSAVDVAGIGDNLQDHVGVAVPVMVHEPPPARAPDIAVSARLGDVQLLAMDRVHGAPGLGLLIAGVLRTHTRGRVAASGVQFELDERDRAALGEAAHLARTVASHPALRAACTVLDVPVDAPERGLYRHAAGTCAMGAVTGADGAVRGYGGLYVADASVIPLLPRAGTHLPTVMIAEKLAYALRRRLGAR